MGDSQGERKDKVHVVVRVRPLIERELIDTDAILAKQSWKLDLTSISNKDCNYRFDKVYGENSTTETIYKDVVAPMVQAAFKGFNGTILCYGQTSSGKTHTLYGSDKDPGIIGYFAEQVSRYLQTQEETDDTVANKENSPSYVIELNLIEIYNEVVKDLLDSENPIDLIEKDGAVVPKSVKNINVMQPGDIKAAAERLQRERKLGETRMNKSSSRSHTILRVKITSLEKPGGDEECPSGVGVGILNFVDLAGSEKLSQTGAVGDRLKEAININTSLSALSRVVMQLSAAQKVTSRDSSSMTTPSCNSVMSTKQPKSRLPPHISYRDSKLTRLLQSSLGGNAHVAIVCNVTPASIEETKSTLVFANNAKSIQIKPTRTYLTKTTDATAYQRYIEELQTQLSGKDKEVSQLKKQLEAMEQLDRKSRKDAPLCDAEEMRRKTFHASLPQRRVRASEGFMDGRKFASLELCSSQRSVWNESLHPNFECSKGTDPASLESLEVIEKIDQESQTSEDLNPSPAKKRRLDNNVPGTPVATLRMQRSLLSQTNDADRHCWEDEKSFLQNELAELKQENEEMKEKLGSHQALEVSKQELKRQLDESTSKFSKEFEDLKFQHSKKVEELKSSKEFEVDTLNAQITKKDGIIKELRQHLEELQTTAQVEESQLDVDVGGKAYNIANESFGIGPITQELIMLKETIEEQERLKAQREERISNLQSKILELKSENLNLSEKLESEMKIAQEQLLAAQSKFEEAVNTKEILQQKYNEVLERNQELAKQAAECKSNCALQIAVLKNENSTLTEKLESEMKIAQEQLLAAQSKFEEAVNTKEILHQEYNEVLEKNQELAKQAAECKSNCALQISVLKNENSTLSEKLESEMKIAQEQLLAAQEQLLALQSKFEEAVNTQEILQQEYNEVLEKNQELAKQAEECKSNCTLQISVLKNENSTLSEKLESEMKIAQEQLLALQSKFEEAVNTQEILQQEYNEVLEKNQALAKQAEECKSNCALQIAVLKNENSTLTEKLESEMKIAQEQLLAAQEQLLAAQSKFEEAVTQEILQQKYNEVLESNQELAKQAAECKSNCALQISVLKNENSTFSEKLESEMKIAQEQLLAAQSKFEEAVNTQEILQQEYNEVLEKNQELAKQAEECKSNCALQISVLKNENSTFSEKLESEMKIAQEQLLAAQSKFEEAVNTKEILQQKYNEVLERNQELAKQAAECKSNCALQIAELKGRNVSDVLKLNEEIAAKERELLNLISKKDDECREKICLQEEEIKNLQSKLKQPLESQSNNSRYTEKLKQDIKTCWEDMKKMETEISELQACIKKQEALIDSRNSEIDELKKSKIAKCSINPEEFEKLKLELGESQSKLNQVENELKSVSAGLEQKLAENRDISTRLEKAQNISRPCTTNRGAQTPVEWSNGALEDYINKMKLHVNKSNFEHAKIVKDLKIKLENYKKDNALEKAANSKEIERLKTVIEDQQLQVTPKTEGVDCEIQCDMMQDLLVRAVKGEKGLLSEKFPEIGRLISENKQKCQRVDLLEKLRTRCTCQDKNSKFSVFKLDHKSQDSQKSDCVEEDSIEKKTGTGKYTLRSRDITGKVAHPGLGIMSAKTSTATKAKASSAFPKKLSYLSGISTLSKSKGKEPVPQKNIQSTKRAFPSEQEDLEVQKVAAATASASQPTTNSQLDQSSSSNGNGNRILTELDNVTSVAEKIQQFNQREKQFSGINERATPCKKKRVDLTEAVTPKKPQVSQETCNSPLITYEELLSLGPPTPAEKKTTSTTKKNSSEEFVFRRLQDISDTEINPDDLFEELLAL